MESRSLGKTGLTVSTLGFGCGNVGGLIIRGTPAERERAVARAIELGINYFDTAPSYGDGQSEQNLGQVLKALKPKVYVGTKFRVDGSDLADIPRAVARSLDASLRRLGLERVDLLQLHNRIEPARGADGRSDRHGAGLSHRRGAGSGVATARERGTRREPDRGVGATGGELGRGLDGPGRVFEPRAPRERRGGGEPRATSPGGARPPDGLVVVARRALTSLGWSGRSSSRTCAGARRRPGARAVRRGGDRPSAGPAAADARPAADRRSRRPTRHRRTRA